MTPAKDQMNQDDYLRAMSMCEDEADPTAAYELLRAAASQGDYRAKYAIATWLLHGMDGVVEKDMKAGFALLKELADSNIAEALFDLAVSYDYGWGTRRNERSAFSCYMSAALLGSAESCEQIAEFYREGTIVKTDPRLYRAWKKRGKQPERDISPPYRLWLRPDPSSNDNTPELR